MSFILSIESLRNAYTVYNIASNFVFATESVIEQIGSNEFNAALRSLNDMKYSSMPERELNMAITQLRTALQHFDSKSNGLFASYGAMKRRFQTALLISVCYNAVHEYNLCEQYRQKSVEYFSIWIEEKGEPAGGKLYAKEFAYDALQSEVNSLGLSWTYSYPASGTFSGFSSSHHREFDDLYRRHKDAIKDQYENFTRELFSN